MPAELPPPPCSAGCDDGWIHRYLNSQMVDEKCGHCNGTGKEPPLSEAELEQRGQVVMPL